MSLLQKIIGTSFLAMIAGSSVLLMHMRGHERLGEPGIRTRPIAGKINCDLVIPQTLPGYTSEILTNSESSVLDYLPSDTSYRFLLYQGTDRFSALLSVVLMGGDRTSIHNPEICMPSQGWEIDHRLTSVQHIPMDSPCAYDLPVNRIISTKVVQDKAGKPQTYRGVYVYWYVDGSHYTEKAWEWRIWWIPRDLLLNGVLERWCYVSLFSSCLPGQEEATFERMKKLITLATPQFQLVPKPKSGA
jgi:hypothetical protein